MIRSKFPLFSLLILWAALLSSCSHFTAISTGRALELKRLAESGDAGAQLMYAQLLDEGAGVPRDITAAVGWYRISAEHGNAAACFELARLQLLGKASALTNNDAVRLLFRAGETGDTRAQALLGALFLTGKGNEEFTAQVKKAKGNAEKGDAAGLYVYGWMLRNGAGVPCSPVEAQRWLGKGAKKGDGRSMLLLGDMTFNGEVAPKNTTAALLWYEKAAVLGNQTAVARLAALHGFGVDGTIQLSIAASPHRAAFAHEYRTLQLDFAERMGQTDQGAALVAARRLLELDPSDRDARDLVERLWNVKNTQLATLFAQADQQLLTGELSPFLKTLLGIMSLNPDEMRLRDLVGNYWFRLDETIRTAEKDGLDILHALESFDTPESVRRNQAKIQKLIAAFNESVNKGLKAIPADPRISSLVHRFDRVTVSLAKKREDYREEHGEERREERKEVAMDSSESQFNKGQTQLAQGKFDSAAKLFEKLTRTQGYKNVAGAYVYLGIISLARINQSKIKEATRLRLKGVTSFQNALRFDSNIALPKDYLKYKDIFEEAKTSLKH
jgi:TPR repeat protein